MGVPGLWDIIRPASQQRSLVHLSIHDGFLSDKHNKRGYRIGIDASIWFFHAHSSREGENPELRMLFFRLAKFLALPLLPLFVFDGPQRPKIKRNKRVMGAQHPLTGSFKAMILAFGFEHHQAPGEAEAELAYLNRLEIIDAVLSDDVDNFLFGATLVMRNPSATLSGNKAHTMKNADGKQDDKHVLLFSSKRTLEHPDIQLQHGGFILMGLMSGGDYDTSGLSKCGIKISHGLARAGFGESLIRVYTETPRHALPAALSTWRAEMCRYLATDPDKLIGRKNKALANGIPESFPSIDVLEAYIRPITSESKGHVPNFEWAKQPSLKEIANRCELHYEWGVKPLIIKRFRTVIWGGALMRVLRAAVMQGDEKEARKARMLDPGLMFTPKNGRRAADMAVGTPSKLITQCLSRMELQSPRKGRGADPFSNEYEPAPDDEPLLVKIHSQRTHASTDGVLEYRVEIAPAQFVRMTEEGLLGLRDEDSIDVANFGKRKALFDDEEDFGDVEEEGGAGKKGKEAVRPNDHLRIWVPACMLEMVQPSLVEDFEGIAMAKERKKLEKEQRAKDKAEGKVSPKKSRVASGSPSKSKAKKTAAAFTSSADDGSDLPTKAAKATSRHKYVSDDGSSDEELGPTPRAKVPTTFKPLNLYSKPSYASSSSRQHEPISETDYMSTDSITDQRLKKVLDPTRSLPALTSRPPIPTSMFPSKSAGPTAGPSMSRTASSKSNSRFPNILSTSSVASSKKFMFTMKPDVEPDEPESSDGDGDLDPYAVLGSYAKPTSSGTSQASGGLAPAGKKQGIKQPVRNTARIEMDFDEASPVRNPQKQLDDSVEDFSYLFSPAPSTEKNMAAAMSASTQPKATTSPTKKRPKFVSNSDSSDEAPRVSKSPKKSQKQKSPPRGPLARLGFDLESSAPPKVKKTTAIPPVAARVKVVKPKETKKMPPAGEVIDLSDSSEEDLVPQKPMKTATKAPVLRGKAQTAIATQARSGHDKGKRHVPIINLDDSF